MSVTQQVDGIGVLVEDLHGFLAVAGLEDRIAGAGQGGREQLPHRRFVFYEQNGFQ